MNDLTYLINWFFVFFGIGFAFLPLTFSIFSEFKDKGYIFSKILGMIFISYLVFILGIFHVLKFSQLNILISVIFLGIINYLIFKKVDVKKIIVQNFKIFIVEEIIF